MLTIRKSLRPLRIAFLVRPRDTAAALRAIQYNTALWGGIYNPIFIAKKKTEKNLHHSMDVFDPDYVIRMSSGIDIELDYPSDRFIEESEFVYSDQGAKHFHFGCGVEAIFDYLWNDRFAFERRYKQEFQLAVFKNHPLEIFQAAWFGQFPDDFGRDYAKSYKQVFEAQEFEVNPDTIGKFPFENCLTPFDINTFGIDVLGNSWRRSYIFLLDGTKIDDIMEFWNFRASIGGNIFPVDLQCKANLIPVLRNFVQNAYRPLPHNSSVFEGTTAIKSTSLGEDVLKCFVQEMDIPKPEDSHLPPLMYSTELPEAKIQRSSFASSLAPAELKVDEEWDEVFVEEGGYCSFKAVSPVFKDFVKTFGKSYWVNELSISPSILASEKYASVVPKGKHIEEKLRREHPRFFDARISRKGLVAFCDHLINSRLSWKLLSDETVVRAWMSKYGIDARINEKGAICLKIMEMMGSLYDCWPLKVDAVRDVLKKLENGRYLPGEEIEAKIRKEVGSDRRKHYQNLFDRLVSLGVLIPGLDFKCEHCLTISWYSLEDLGTHFRCSRCLAQNRVPALHKTNRWQYRSNGVLGIEKSSQGGIGTVLALKFLQTSLGGLSGTGTFIPNFEAFEGSNLLGEIDFAFLRRGSAFFDNEVVSVIGECKTNYTFSAKDARTMKTVAEKIPGCFIAFTTLNDRLTENEKAVIKKIAEWGRKYIGDGQRLHPVLVFTKTEMLSNQFLHCWEAKGSWVSEKANQLGYAKRPPSTLLEIAEATQRIHLDMPAFYGES